MLYSHVLSLMASTFLLFPWVDDPMVRRANGFRDWVRQQSSSSLANRLDGQVKSVEEKAGRRIIEYTDGSVGVEYGTNRISSFITYFSRMDEAWQPSAGLTRSRLEDIANEAFRVAGYRDALRVAEVQKWGGVGADYPHMPNMFRVSCTRHRDGVRFGFYVVTDFEIDAVTGQLLWMGVGPVPFAPTDLRATITSENARAVAYARLFADNPTLELTEQVPSQLTICDPRVEIPRNNQSVPSYVRQAAQDGRGVLAYEMIISNMQGGYAYAAVDAKTGEIMYVGHFDHGLGGGSKLLRTSRWHWNAGSVEVLSKSKRVIVKGGDIVDAKKPDEPGPGKPVTLVRSGVAIQAKLHTKQGLLSRESKTGTIYGKPNAPLLKALKKLAGG